MLFVISFLLYLGAIYQGQWKAVSKLFDLRKEGHLLKILILKGSKVIDNDVDNRGQFDRQLKLTYVLLIPDSIEALTGQLSSLL